MKTKKNIFWYIDSFFLRAIDKITGFPREVKWFIQRGKRGWADCDTWDFGTYLASVIAHGTEHLAKYVHGHPCSSPEDKMTQGKWIDILYTISSTFSWEQNICEGNAYYIPSNRPESEYNEMKNDFKEVHKRCKADPGRIMTRNEAKEYEQGWKLFRKYFGHLWD